MSLLHQQINTLNVHKSTRFQLILIFNELYYHFSHLDVVIRKMKIFIYQKLMSVFFFKPHYKKLVLFFSLCSKSFMVCISCMIFVKDAICCSKFFFTLYIPQGLIYSALVCTKTCIPFTPIYSDGLKKTYSEFTCQ